MYKTNNIRKYCSKFLIDSLQLFPCYVFRNHQKTFGFLVISQGMKYKTLRRIGLKLRTSFSQKKPRQRIIRLSIVTLYNCQKQLKDKNDHIYKIKERTKYWCKIWYDIILSSVQVTQSNACENCERIFISFEKVRINYHDVIFFDK